MPRPLIFGTSEQTHTNPLFDSQTTSRRKAEQMNSEELDTMLRHPRSKAYMDAIHQLDAGGHVHTQHREEEILNAIRNEFPEIDIHGILLGLVSKCYLGAPYEVHSLDITGRIIEHFKMGQPLPDGLEKARSLAIHGGYDVIEVYVDCCRCISENGNVSIVRG